MIVGLVDNSRFTKYDSPDTATEEIVLRYFLTYSMYLKTSLYLRVKPLDQVTEAGVVVPLKR